ncbi:MAG: tRNA modification GTPase, partial [Candidatus Saganbacteria bacterium]|nr:tRNA modification GTPase [Candidatus Saganbacteria bacterium]
VIDLIRARTRGGIKLAANQLRGGLSKRIKEIRETLLSSLAGIEASIDFPDDTEGPNKQKLKGELGSVLQGIDGLLQTAQTGKILREGIATAIIGRANVGKSSLLNALLREERAIVTDIPGTTRDAIEERLNIKGIPLIIIDTAGRSKAEGKIERISQEKARDALDNAELVLCVIDISSDLTAEDLEGLGSCIGKKTIVVLNKIDISERVREKDIRGVLKEAPMVRISALYGNGIQELEDAIAKLVISDRIIAGNEAIVSNNRHKECLVRAKESIERALESANKALPEDFVSIDLKGAIVALGEVTGETVTGEIIDKIFEEFCVGK